MTAKDNFNKYGLAALKGGIGSIPGGSLVVELLNVTIPDRRLERIEKILMILAFILLNLQISLKMLFIKLSEH